MVRVTCAGACDACGAWFLLPSLGFSMTAAASVSCIHSKSLHREFEPLFSLISSPLKVQGRVGVPGSQQPQTGIGKSWPPITGNNSAHYHRLCLVSSIFDHSVRRYVRIRIVSQQTWSCFCSLAHAVGLGFALPCIKGCSFVLVR